jgi:hypothetical protein
MHPSASLLVSAGIATLALLAATLVVGAYAWVMRKDGAPRAALPFAIGVGVWVTAVAVLGAAGPLRSYDARPPPMMLLGVAGIVLAIATARSRIGERFARGLPLAAIIGFHAFRLPLELVMHRAATEGTMPVQMSFSGFNFDILSGVTAIIVAGLAARGAAPRWLLWAWAVLSSVLLAVIVGIAIASTPIASAFGAAPERVNTFIGWFPFTWLPCVLVPSALFGQIVLVRRLSLGSIV